MTQITTQATRGRVEAGSLFRWGVALAALALFIALALAVRRFALLPGEEAVMRAIQSLPWPAMGTPMVVVSAFGYQPYSGLAAGGSFLFFLWRRLNAEAVSVALAVSCSLVSSVVKDLVGRERPHPDVYQVYYLVAEPSFPSGHTFFYTALFGLLFYVLWTRVGPSLLRAVGLLLTGVLVLLVGLSRVYLGAHFPADVLGGYVLGGLWLAGTIAVYRRLRVRLGPALGKDSLDGPLASA